MTKSKGMGPGFRKLYCTRVSMRPCTMGTPGVADHDRFVMKTLKPQR